MKPILIDFVGIDRFNRPVFKDDLNNHYGSIDKLFQYTATREEVLGKVTEKDLLFFGSSFGCEPIGDPVISTLEIRKN